MTAHVTKRDACGQLCGNLEGGRLREQNLPAMPDHEEPENPIEGRSEVVPVALFRCAGMQGHPHPYRADFAPVFRLKTALRLDGGVERIQSRRKARAKSVADSLEDVSA